MKGTSPTAETVKEVHELIFSKALVNAGEFRDQDTPLRQSGEKEKAFSSHDNIKKDLDNNSEKTRNLTEIKERDELTKKLAEFHAGIMAIHPFRDIGNSTIINRTVAAALTEGQLTHCVKGIKHEIDGEKYHKAIHECLQTGFIDPLQKIIKDVANVIDIKKGHDRGPSGGHEY